MNYIYILFNKNGNVFMSFIILYIIFFIYKDIGLIFVFLTYVRIARVIKQGMDMIGKYKKNNFSQICFLLELYSSFN